jgi:hypothetical protein
MADLEHLELLKQGVTAWNLWRKEQPDLSDADLSTDDPSYFNLSATNFRGANLYTARLTGANLRRANLHEAVLNRTDLSGADLNGADLSQARVGGTHFANLDLRQVKGLDTITHLAPSHISIATIYRSQGDIPEAFLRGAGAPDTMIEYMHSLAGKPIDYYTCFISYSGKDQVFAERLYADLQSNGVRCWFAPEDMKIGNEIRTRIDESIRVYDKLLLVLSEHAIESAWVKDEVEAALEKEKRQQQRVLFPIAVDDAVKHATQAWAATIRRRKHIGNFTRWEYDKYYQQAFDRLLRDLKSETHMSC